MIDFKKLNETGSSPCYVNLDNTAKDFSLSETTNPQFGLLDTLSKFVIIENNIKIEPIQIRQEFIIDRHPTK
jgi:hypothetical protein